MIETPNPFTLTSTQTPLETPPPLPWGWREIVKALLFIIVGILVIGALIIGVGVATGALPLPEGQGMAAAPLFWLGMAIYGVVALAVYLFAVRPAQGHWSQLGFGSFSWGWLFMAPVITLTMLFGMGLVNVLFVMPFTGGEFENPQIEALTGGSALSLAELGVLMILVAVVAPIVEELFFRGMLYPVLRRRWSAPVAIVVNGFLFALIHVIPILLPGLFFVGIVLAWVRERSGSVIPCMVIHALQNGTVLLVIYATLNGLIS
jgi:membrane protease YdiL (CAAX protease family)